MPTKRSRPGDTKADALKDALDKLEKDLKDDPAAIKQAEDLLQRAQKPNPLPPARTARPRRRGRPAAAIPTLAPGIDGWIGTRN